jgi:imidazole glycerol-phosphate synthase subunit HisF
MRARPKRPAARASALSESCTRFSESTKKFPHVGWNSLEVAPGSRLARGVSPASLSTSRTPTKRPVTADTAAVTHYIEPFAAAVERGNVLGVQFHPEKSGATGLKILSNFSQEHGKGTRSNDHQAHHRLPRRARGRVVKGVQFVDLIDAGDPATQAARHAREGADEIVLLDITATHEGRQTLLDTVRRTARELFVPFCVGGGIRSADDAEQVFEAGADKVSINSAALADPTLIDAIGAALARRPSSSPSTRAAIPTPPIRSAMRRSLCKGAASAHGRRVVEWAREAEQRGAGEILLTSMDSDGTRAGFDCELTAAVSESVSIPVIASGGAGTVAHFADVFARGKADAALAASIFHFGVSSARSLKEELAKTGVP